MKKVYGKLGRMRKSVDWVVYPPSRSENESKETGDLHVFIQSDRRCCKINVRTGKGMLSKSCNFPGFAQATKFMGAEEIDVPREFIEECLEAQPKSGDHIGGNIFVA